MRIDPTPSTTPVPRRERLRAEALAEIRALAMAQIAAGGPRALSLTGIARRMGLSGPALYRYCAGRDALLAQLVADAFTDLTDVVDAAVGQASRGDPEVALRTVGRAYRSWALAHPHEYTLLTVGVPVDQPRAALEAATRRALDVVVAAVAMLAGGPAGDARAAWLEPFAVVVWQRLHGHLSIELEGIHAAMGLDPAAVFEQELASVVADARARWATDAPSHPSCAAP